MSDAFSIRVFSVPPPAGSQAGGGAVGRITVGEFEVNFFGVGAWPDPDTYLDDLYDAAAAELPGVVARLESGAVGARLRCSTRT
jgi:hypothetical protein